MLTGQDFLAKKRFCPLQSWKKGQIQVLLKYLQDLNKNQTLLIKMATVHNSMIDPFGFPL